MFENPNSEHTRARHDPQSTIFNNVFAKNDARRSRKPLGPVLTPKKALKQSKFHKTPKSLYIFENPNSEHTRARHDPQSTIFKIFFAKNDARTSGKHVGPVLTPKKAIKKSKIHKTPESPTIQIFQPKKGKKRAQSFAG